MEHTTTFSDNLFNKRLNLLFHLAIWGTTFLVAILLSSRFWSLGYSILRTIGNMGPLVVLFYVNLYFVNKYLERKKYLPYLIFVVFTISLITLLRNLINGLFPDIKAQVMEMPQSLTWTVAGIILGISVIYIGILYQLMKNARIKERKSLEMLREKQEAEVQFLRAQINPHFLFNTLNNIYALAVGKSEKTAQMVLKLSDLLRYVIYDGRIEVVTISKEVAHIKAFIELFQMKSDEPYEIEFRTIGPLEEFQLEPMILIPIVENSFKHCDFDSRPDAFVHIDLEVSEGKLYFRTINSKNDGNRQKDKVGGVGLENIRKRLEYKYGPHYLLEINNEKESFEVKLFIDLNKDEE